MATCDDPAGHHAAALAELVTVRDWLRYAASVFGRAGLIYGHGTTNALDEAAFMLLMSLDLPIDSLEPWLDAKLTSPERAAFAALVARRIESRKPAAYLLNAAFIQGHRFYVDERVIVPRSYIGELLSDALATVVPDPCAIGRVLDLCTGSGCLAILAASAFPGARVDAVELSPDALAVAARNVADYGLVNQIALIQSDLFASLEPSRCYDLIIANPPYVAAAEVAAFSPEYRAEPELAHLGGADGLDLVHRILRDAAGFLRPGGMLVVEIGTARERLEAAYPAASFLWLDTEASEGEVFALSAPALAAMQGSPNRRRRK